jgi:hypothetical protein
MSLFEKPGVNNAGAHAFYLQTETAKISRLPGKRCTQDASLVGVR